MLVKDSGHFFRIWVALCKGVTKVFYRRLEVDGDNQFSTSGGIIYCANHVNALVDPAIVQATTPHVLRPLARSGLFNTLYSPALKLIGAIPIFRASDKGVNTAQNQDSFAKVYELLARNENVVIFPEGQSHSDPHLNRLKTGAARMALGAIERNSEAPLIIPIGLNFSHKGRFRGDVLVKYGEPIAPSPRNVDDCSPKQRINLDKSVKTRKSMQALDAPSKIKKNLITNKVTATFLISLCTSIAYMSFPRLTDLSRINELTEQISQGLQRVTLNTQSWQDMHLVKLLERFFAMRRGKHSASSLGQRFSSLQRIIEAQNALRDHAPQELRHLTSRLRFFERVCAILGVQNYHLDIEYRPRLVMTYIFKSLLMLLIGLPIALVGAVNALITYLGFSSAASLRV